MNLKNPIIAVIGAGAVGGYYGARLAQHGHDVHFHMRSDYQAVRRDGLRITSPDGDFFLSPQQIHVYDDPAKMPKADLILITLKTTANDFLRQLVTPVLKNESALLTLQNGLGNEQRLAELFGPGCVMGGMAFVCINRASPGAIVHLDHGMVRIGELAGPPGDRAYGIANLFSNCKIPCKVLEDLMTGRWEKLIWNVPFNGLGALLDRSTDQLIGSEEGLAAVRNLMREIIDIAASIGIGFKPSIMDDKIRNTLTMGPYQTSMQIDRQMHRPMEIEAILGESLRVGQKQGVATPYLKMLYEMLRLASLPNTQI